MTVRRDADPAAKHAEVQMGAKAGRFRLVAAALLLAAASLRLIPTIISPSLNWGDEVFQVTEPAHRLVFGTGLLTWEFAAGIRSWLLPGLAAFIMELGHPFGAGPRFYLPAISLCFAALSMIPVICTFAWCRPLFGTWAAAAGASVCALAPELIYFGGRSSAETAAGHLLVGAFYLCIPKIAASRGGTNDPRARPLIGGLVLGLALALRPQILPAALVLGVWPGWRGRWRLVAGAALALAAACLLDWPTLGSPGASIWRYALVDVGGEAGAGVGAEPWYYYLVAELAIWGPILLCPVALCLLASRRWLLPLAAAASIIAAHMLIAHKEHRYIYPALSLCAVSAGIGLADLASRLGRWRGRPRLAASACILVWSALCLVVWQAPAMTALRARVRDQLLIADYAAGLPGICGIGMGPARDAWVAYGGYTHLHQNVPLFWPADQGAFAHEQAGFNLLLSQSPEPGYTPLYCAHAVCAFKRTGACTRLPPDLMPPRPSIHFHESG